MRSAVSCFKIYLIKVCNKTPTQLPTDIDTMKLQLLINFQTALRFHQSNILSMYSIAKGVTIVDLAEELNERRHFDKIKKNTTDPPNGGR